MDDTDIAVIEKNLLEKFFQLTDQENKLTKPNKELSSEIDRIQSALMKIRSVKSKKKSTSKT